MYSQNPTHLYPHNIHCVLTSKYTPTNSSKASPDSRISFIPFSLSSLVLFFLCLPVEASLFLHVLVVLVDGCMVNAATESSSRGESVLFILTSSNKSPFFMPILDLEYARNFCKFSQKIVLVQKSNHLFIWKKINLYSYHFKKRNLICHISNVYLLFTELKFSISSEVSFCLRTRKVGIPLFCTADNRHEKKNPDIWVLTHKTCMLSYKVGFVQYFNSTYLFRTEYRRNRKECSMTCTTKLDIKKKHSFTSVILEIRDKSIY